MQFLNFLPKTAMFTTKEDSLAHNDSASKVLNQSHPDSLLINHNEKNYPFCIVWTKAPTITSFFPCFGHVGIAGSDGKIHDYAGNSVEIDNFAYDVPYKYVQLNLQGINLAEFDKALRVTDSKFHQTKYHLFKNNCYHFVANTLSEAGYKSERHWTMLDVVKLTVNEGKYIKKSIRMKVYLKHFMLLLLIHWIVMILKAFVNRHFDF